MLRVASLWKLGERSGGGVEPLIVFSNCDRVVVYVGSQKRGEYRPDSEAFPHLPHAPFVCRGIGGVWGGYWRDLRVVGLIKGKKVAEQRIAAEGVPKQFICRADDAGLVADGADMTRIGFCVADRYGNVLPYAMSPVALTVTGPGTLVGENPFCLAGGVGALYLRAGRRAGVVRIVAQTPRLPAQMVTVEVKAAPRNPV